MIDSNGEVIYEPNVLTAATTTITAMLGGGSVGTYTIKVDVDGSGHSIGSPVILEYKISLSAVSPAEGSKYGGTVLTLTG